MPIPVERSSQAPSQSAPPADPGLETQELQSPLGLALVAFVLPMVLILGVALLR